MMLADMIWADWVGLIGSICIAGAYFGVSSGAMNGEGARFQSLNLLGAILILISLYYRPNLGAIVIEILWVVIAIYTLAKIWLRRG